MPRVNLRLRVPLVITAHRPHALVTLDHVILEFGEEPRVLHLGNRRGELGAHAGDFVRRHANGGRTGRRGALHAVPRAQLQLELVREGLLDAAHDAAAAGVVVKRLGVDGLQHQPRAVLHAIGQLAARLDAPAGEDRRRVAEGRFRATPVEPRIEVIRLMPEIRAPRVAAPDELRVAMRVLAEQEGLLRQLQRGVRAVEAVTVAGIFVAHAGAADLDVLEHFPLRIRPVNPELVRALLHLIGHADGNGIEIRVKARHWRLEQQPPRERLELVIREARHRLRLEDDRGLAAVPGEDLDRLTVHQPVGGAEVIRPGDALGGQLLDDLPHTVVRGPGIRDDVLLFVMLLDAVEAAAVVAQRARLGRRRRRVIAVEHVALALVHAHIQSAAALRIESLHRRIAIDRIELVRLDVAEQSFARFLLRIEARREQIFALDAALEEERSAAGGGELPVVAVHGEVAQFLLESIA